MQKLEQTVCVRVCVCVPRIRKGFKKEEEEYRRV